MNVLGIAAFYHDASATVVRDGVVVASVTEERLSLIKHDHSYPRLAIDACLQQAGITAGDLDAVALHEDPAHKFPRVLATAMAGFPRTLGMFTQAMKTWLGGHLWVRNRISRELGIHPKRIHPVRHHHSHAAQGFAASPFREAAILVVDAIGEWACTSMFAGRVDADGQLRLDLLEEHRYPHSLGLVYAAFTAFLGFQVNDGECSTMALAAFGRPRYVDAVRRIVRVHADGTYDVDPSFFDFGKAAGLPLRPAFFALFGAPRDPRTPLPFDCLHALGGAGAAGFDADSQRFVDVAASVQLVIEDALSALARRARQRTGLPHLCLVGGVALNCVANRRLLAEGTFDDVFVPPDPGDGGASMGAALYGAMIGLGERHRGFEVHPYLGLPGEVDRDLAALVRLRPAAWARFREPAAVPITGTERLLVTRYDDTEALLAPVVDDLRAGRIVGWFQGRFENGPRALGNRSLLVDPANVAAARRLSAATKQRQAYRPYALAMTAAAAPRLLAGPTSRLHRWMQAAMPVRPECVPAVAAALHIDRTTRPQVCHVADNPRFHALLTAFGEATGTPALLNTSFNPSGLPIVSTPVEAMLMMARTDLDTLVLDSTVIRKRT